MKFIGRRFTINFKYLFRVLFVSIPALLPYSALAGEPNVKFIMAKKGSCLSEHEKIDLNEIYFLSDTKLVKKNTNGYELWEVDGEKFYLGQYSSGGEFVSKYFTNVSMEIVEKVKNSKDMDVQLSFVLVDGAVALYWKETFIHRVYNQGIFKINGNNLVYLCSGKGGIQSGH